MKSKGLSGHRGRAEQTAGKDEGEGMRDFLAELHDGHDCNPGPCLCKCGCSVKLGCRTVLGGLCSKCHIAYIRGDEVGHDFPETVEDMKKTIQKNQIRLNQDMVELKKKLERMRGELWKRTESGKGFTIGAGMAIWRIGGG